MSEFFHKAQKSTLSLVIILTLLISVSLAVSTYYINYWPTDSQSPYIPVATKIFKLKYISDIHRLPLPGILKVNMHGKEALIVGIALMQYILKDSLSLYPNVLLLILCVGLSSILVYLIIKRLFGHWVAFISYLLFTFCLWPYLYILQGAHQPLSLVNFLLALYFLQLASRYNIFYLISGLFLGVMLFSSPTAPLYLPYYFVFLIFQEYREHNNLFKMALKGILFSIGFFSVIALFLMPDFLWSIKHHIHFIRFSQHGNNFMIYRDYLKQFFPLTDGFRGAGWIWIIKYIFLIMPVLSILYVASIFYLLNSFQKKIAILFFLLVSLSSPIIVEAIKVVQFGRNYFPWLVGILGFVSFALYRLKTQMDLSQSKAFTTIMSCCVVCALAVHVSLNTQRFLTDIYPSRMATAHNYNWCVKNSVSTLHAYRKHPLHKNTVQFFNNPKQKEKISFVPINNIREVHTGYILIPPITGKTVFVECRMDNFHSDPYLTELYLSGEFQKYVVASFPTIATSRIWNMEEEICAYRDLVAAQVTDEDRQRGYTHILDAQKLQNAWFAKHYQNNN